MLADELQELPDGDGPFIHAESLHADAVPGGGGGSKERIPVKPGRYLLAGTSAQRPRRRKERGGREED
jgi:hypothetical protein